MKRLKTSITSVGIVAVLFMLVFAFLSYEYFYAVAVKDARDDLERCMLTFRELLTYKEEGFRIVDGKLLVGDYVINNNFDVPDKVQKIFGETATVFMGDERVSTNVLLADGRRAVGTRLEGPAYEAIFKQGKAFRGETLILGKPYLTAYDPIRDINGTIIGVLYVGLQKTEFLARYSVFKTHMVLILLGVLTVFTIFMTLFSRLFNKAEREKAAEHTFLQTLMDTIPNPLFYKDVHGTYTGGNKAFADFLGIPIEQLIGKTVFDFQPYAQANQIHKAELELVQNQTSLIEETSITITDGAHRDVIISKATYPAADGSLGGLIGTILDITERKQMEKGLVINIRFAELRAEIGAALGLNQDLRVILQRCSELLAEYLDVAFFRIWTLNKAEQVLEMQASAGMYTHINGPHGRVPVGMFKIGMIASERQPHLTNDVQNDPRIGDKEWARREKMVAFAGYPLIVADRLVGVMATFARTTIAESILEELGTVAGRIAQCIARKQTESDNNRLAAILNATTDLVGIADPAGKVVYLNLAARNLLGVVLDEDITKTFIADFIPNPDSHPSLTEGIPSAIRDGQWRGDVNLISRRGQEIPVSQVILVHKTPDGKLEFISTIMRDITERKAADNTLKMKNAEIEQFTYAVSHDLRSPLVTVKTFLGYLSEDMKTADPERIEQDLQYICSAADKMELLLNELMELSRIGHHMNPPVSVSFRQLADEALAAVAGQIAGRKVTVQVIDADLTLTGDRPRLAQIWQNLLDNAVKYMGAQTAPRIEIGIEQQTEETLFCIRDNGMGVAPENLEKLFVKFAQVDKKSAGVGLGLAMVKRIVELYGGRIWVESKGIGHGSSFFFTLPEALNVC
jgi:PAS domain S-box-containing protein